MTKVIVYHRGYGCDTGCCGHVVAIERDSGEEDETFEFTHPYGEDRRVFVERVVTEEYGAEHVADIDWENCVVVND